jgi:hemolysin activation/secretion protein
VERPLARPVDQRPSRLTVEGGVERAPCALAAPEFRSVTFTLNRVVFDNLKGLPPEALQSAYADYVGKQEPVSVICDIRDRAATILREAGYIAAVQVPEQKIADGTVRFDVLMAKLVAVRVRGDAGRAERTIAGYLGHLTQSEVFNRFEAERYLLLAGDLPGYDVRLSLRSANAGRGEVVGEVAVLHRPGRLDLNVQNFGSHELGPWGALLRGEVYGLTGLGDRTTLAAFSTVDFSEQQTIQAGHDFRVGSEGLTLSGQFTYAWAHPSVGAGLDVRARTLVATGQASFPFVRSQAATLRGSAGLDVVNQSVGFNGIALSNDRLRVGFVRLDLDRVDERSVARIGGFSPLEPRWRGSLSAEVRQGLGIFGASRGCGTGFALCLAPGAVPPSRLEGNAKATVLRGSVYGEFRPVPKVTLSAGVRAQYAHSPLLSFEEFSLGNYTAGRGYDPGTLLGDSGVGFQTELRFGSPFPHAARSWAFQPYLFLDGGRVWNRDRLTAPVGPQSLMSAGGGVRAAYGDSAHFDVTLAVPLQHSGILGDRPDPRLLVSFTTTLLPWSL